MAKNKSTLSILPLQPWMTYYVDFEEGREENRLPRIQPIIKRDGYYYDRKQKMEWYEYKGNAFVTHGGHGAQFRYELKLANAHILGVREVLAYQEMLKIGVPKSIRVQIKEILDTSREIVYLRDLRRSSYQIIKRFKEK